MLNCKVKFVEIPEINGEEVRKSTIERIEEITLQIIEEIDSENFPKITYGYYSLKGANSTVQKSPDKQSGDILPRGNLKSLESNSTTSFDSSRSLSWVYEAEEDQDEEVEPVHEDEEDAVRPARSSTTVDFRLEKSRRNLVLILTVMSHVHRMLINRTTRTRRSLYYELQSEPTSGLVRTQRLLDDAVNHVASLLERAPWDLGFTASSKGLVFGDLVLTFPGGDSVSCDSPGGLLIPQNIFRVVSARSSARYVVVVEKDAVFQRLLEDDCPNYLNCILVTGKGYPDLDTRMLVSLLGNRLEIPVYVLVDADPFGVEIMCIYRFGSCLRSREQEELSCPKVRWIGIHPSEYSGLGISPNILNGADKARLESLKKRIYMNKELSNELEIISEKGKVEIESVANLSGRFLTTIYLPQKINAQEFI